MKMSATIGQAAVGVFLSALALMAQGTGQINGSVRDPSGAGVPGAEVKATQTGTGTVRTVTSGLDGTYVLASLPVGPYRLEVAKQGFNQYVQSGITLEVNSNLTIDITLKVGAVTDTVQVQANAVQVETQETGVGQVIDNQRVLDLPLAARNSQQLVILAGGAVGGGGVAANRSYPVNLISVAGALTDAVTYVLDGGLDNEPYVNSAMPLPFPDALQEFKVETSAAPAQYGGHSGGVVQMVTKSGTNEFHGTAFEFIRNGYFNARNAFAVTRDNLKRNQFGGVIGGPVKKDKLFFFFGDQYTKTVALAGTTIANVPTAQSLTGDFTALASPACNAGRQITLKSPFVNNKIPQSLLDPAAVALTKQKYWVTPNNVCGTDVFAQLGNSNEQMIIGKVDYQINAKNSIFGRVDAAILHQPSDFNGQDILSMTQPNYTRHAHSMVLGDTYIVNNYTVASFRATGLRTLNSKVPAIATFTPADLGVTGVWYPPTWPKMTEITVSGGFRQGSANYTPGYTNGTIFQESGDIAMTKGSHQIGYGANLIHTHLAYSTGTSAPGQYSFSAQNTGLAMADFLLGDANSFTQSMVAPLYLMQYSADMYVQDTWKVNRHLTIIGGLRWEPYLSPYSKYVQAGFFTPQWFQQGLKSKVFPNAPAGLLFAGDPGVPISGSNVDTNSWAHFAPRLGFAWDPGGNGKMVVRIAAGKFFDYGHLDTYRNILNTAPTGGQISLSGVRMDNPYANFPGGNPFPLVFGPNAVFPAASTGFGVQLGLKHPVVNQWNIAIQRQLTPTWLLTVAYEGSLAVHEVDGHESNPGIYIPGNCVAGQYGLTAPGACSTASNLQARRTLSLLVPGQSQEFAGFNLVDDRGVRSYNGLMLSLQRRVGKGFTALANYTWSHCIDNGLSANSNTVQTYNPARAAFDRGNCELDRRQNFNFSAVYQAPEFSNHMTRLLVTGWQASTVFHMATGPWITVAAGIDNALASTGDEWASYVGPSPYASNKGVATSLWLNPAAFVQPATGTYGNMAAQNIQGPGSWNVDVALARQFRITEKYSIQLRAEALNLMNHVNPGGVSVASSGATSGAGSPAALLSGVDVTLSDPLFGRIVNAADPRIMQLAMKFTF